MVKAVAASLLAVIGLGACAHLRAVDAPLEVRAFDIGYGDAILVSAGDTHVLFDTGPEDAGPRLIEKLRAAGVRRLAAVVLSHSHPDHAGGLKALVDAGLAIDTVLHDPATDLSAFERLQPKAKVVDRSSAPYQVGALTLRFLHPGRERHSDPNNGSLVVLVQSGGASALMTGDLVDVPLQAALCPRLPPTLWVLKAPHHGDHMADCLTSRAEHIVVSVAANRWGVPRPEVVARHGAKLRRTDVEGDVVLSSVALRRD